MMPSSKTLFEILEEDMAAVAPSFNVIEEHEDAKL